MQIDGLSLAQQEWVLEEVAARLNRITRRLDDLERRPPPEEHGNPASDKPPRRHRRAALDSNRTSDVSTDESDAFNVYLDLNSWVAEYFAPTYPRPLGGQWRWCTRWPDHPEAVARLTALWRTWEALQWREPAGVADWLRGHLDHQLPILLGSSGPFAGCSLERHEPHRTLPLHLGDPPSNDAARRTCGWTPSSPVAAMMRA